MKYLANYEEAKKKELTENNPNWEYICCYDRNKSRHIVRCAICGTERKIDSLKKKIICKSCERIARKQEEEQKKYKACIVCGVSFKPTRSTAIYCSKRCSKRAYEARHINAIRERRKTNSRLREARALKNGKVDYSITLTKLIERDKRICRLCGREVNESDYTYIGDVFIAGNDYPSIDHIKPLSKGGVHQWNNVQLAHRLCNSIKCNKEK